MLRRRLFFAAAASLATSTAMPASAALGAPGSAAGPLRVGVDRSLVESGLAAHLRRAFAADTGIAVRLVAGPAMEILDAIQNGEVDAALTNAPDAEAELDRQGLVHDRRSIASGEFVLVGPVQRLHGKTPAASHSGVA
ncbi:MAG: LysR substrate-binding domain-containing protein, partial [Caldimonas sp.]